jgi:hypothetical protein
LAERQPPWQLLLRLMIQQFVLLVLQVLLQCGC